MKFKQAVDLSYKEFTKLSETEQIAVTKQLTKNVSTRRSKLTKAGYEDSPALAVYDKSGSKRFTYTKTNKRGQKVNKGTLELWRQTKRAQKFLKSTTSTVKGSKELMETTANRLIQTGYSNLSFTQQSNFWKIYNQMKDTGAVELLKGKDLSSDYIQTLVYEMYEQGYDYTDTELIEDLIASNIGYEFDEERTQLNKIDF